MAGLKIGLFGLNAPFTSDLSLLFQLVIFVFLIVGVAIARVKRIFIKHGVVMGITFIFHSLTIVIIMIPSLQGFRGLFSTPFLYPALVVFAHSILGILIEIFGLWIFGLWRFRRQDIRSCAKHKKFMQITLILWIMELVLGVYVYVLLYYPI